MYQRVLIRKWKNNNNKKFWKKNNVLFFFFLLEKKNIFYFSFDFRTLLQKRMHLRLTHLMVYQPHSWWILIRFRFEEPSDQKKRIRLNSNQIYKLYIETLQSIQLHSKSKSKNFESSKEIQKKKLGRNLFFLKLLLWFLKFQINFFQNRIKFHTQDRATISTAGFMYAIIYSRLWLIIIFVLQLRKTISVIYKEKFSCWKNKMGKRRKGYFRIAWVEEERY